MVGMVAVGGFGLVSCQSIELEVFHPTPGGLLIQEVYHLLCLMCALKLLCHTKVIWQVDFLFACVGSSSLGSCIQVTNVRWVFDLLQHICCVRD